MTDQPTHECDVLVCGGGPAGIAAAVYAARSGAKVQLIETHGCLGGVWTAGALSWIIDHENKTGLIREILARLEAVGGRAVNSRGQFCSGYDVETMKVVLDALSLEAGVAVRLHTRVCGAVRDPAGRDLTHITTESTSGRELWSAKVFVDCTGDGDLGAQAGCGYDMGRPGSGQVQPMTLMALLTGVNPAAIQPYVWDEGLPFGPPQAALRQDIERTGPGPSYALPTLFPISNQLYALMANHQYGVRCDDADGITRSTMEARAKLHRVVRGLRSLGGVWGNLTLVATGSQIGVREGRRLHGLYTVNADDVRQGARHADAICRATFGVDVHSTDPTKDKGLGCDNVHAQPYDIPLRALIARDVNNLLMAGRCISGDFWAHASYRVTGNAVAMGEAAGWAAACAARRQIKPDKLPFAEVAASLREARETSPEDF